MWRSDAPRRQTELGALDPSLIEVPVSVLGPLQNNLASWHHSPAIQGGEVEAGGGGSCLYSPSVSYWPYQTQKASTSRVVATWPVLANGLWAGVGRDTSGLGGRPVGSSEDPDGGCLSAWVVECGKPLLARCLSWWASQSEDLNPMKVSPREGTRLGQANRTGMQPLSPGPCRGRRQAAQQDREEPWAADHRMIAPSVRS